MAILSNPKPKTLITLNKFAFQQGRVAAGSELGATVEISVGSAVLQKPFVETLS